jgi:hypothetical protein
VNSAVPRVLPPTRRLPQTGVTSGWATKTGVGQRKDRSIEAYGRVNGRLPADGIWLGRWFETGRKEKFRLRFDLPKRHVIRALELVQEVCGDIVKCVRWVLFAPLLFSSLPCSDASALHWITRLGHTNCDNHPVAETHAPGLIQRSEQEDVDAPLQFEVEEPFASLSSLTLVVCNGEVHVPPEP